jgi:hypothetical protein
MASGRPRRGRGTRRDRPRPHQLHDLLVTVVDNLNAELETLEVRDEIVARNPALLPRTLAVQRAWEQELADSLARRRSCPVGDPTAQTDAALVLLIIRLAFRRRRAGDAASWTQAVAAALETVEGAWTARASLAVEARPEKWR